MRIGFKKWALPHIIILLAGLLFCSNSLAEGVCKGRFTNPITDVCWSCLFPMSLGGATLMKSHHPDTKNPKSPVCTCGSPYPRAGITVGFWEPIRLVDVTRTPFCLVNMSGVKLDVGHLGRGEVDSPSDALGGSFYHVHVYKYLLLTWLNLMTDALCLDSDGFDIDYLSELDPLWKNDSLNAIVNPEAVLFGNLIGQAACAGDSIKASTGLPSDTLFWCAGAQGSMYPLNGHVQEHVGGVQASTLLAERAIYREHRFGFLWDTGETLGSICQSRPHPIMPKSRYRYQMTYPKPTTTQAQGCYPFGHTTTTWESFHEYPYTGEDFGYLIWRKRNCCAG